MRLASMVGLAAALLLSGLAAAGCSASAAPVCTGSLGTVAEGCPATFAGSLDIVDCALWPNQALFTCAGLDVVEESGGAGGVLCAYDSSAHALVGARRATDEREYCDGSSSEQTGGRFPDDACFEVSPVATRTCPPFGVDGGSDLADARGVSE